MFGKFSAALRLILFIFECFRAMKGKAVLSLKQFMVRQQVLKLYRDFFRTARELPEGQREDIIEWVRSDFKSNKSVPVTDEEQIKALVINGEKMLRELKQSVDLSKA